MERQRTKPERSSGAAELATKWSGAHGGEAWSLRRWGGRRRAGRDPRAVAQLLREAARLAGTAAAPHDVGGPDVVLDVACGTGRLRDAIVAHPHSWVGVDASLDQLRAASGARLCGSALALPLATASVAGVVACRFLHHLADDGDFARAVAELVRVSRSFVIASYWDRATWPYLVRRGPRDDSGRVARRTADVDAAFERAGAQVVCVQRPVWRWSAQTFVLARRRDAHGA